MMKDLDRLDNPVVASLTETHEKFRMPVGNLLAYEPEIAPFGAFTNTACALEELDHRLDISDNFVIFSEEELPVPHRLNCRTFSLFQMINFNEIRHGITENIVLLNGRHEEELLRHMQQFYPGYYRKGTPRLGNYYGIFVDDQLAAVAGERFQSYDFCEISAVVTHAAFTGRGFAKQLMAFLNNRILDSGKLPFLHVTPKNTGAVGLYKSLGFNTRETVTAHHFLARQL